LWTHISAEVDDRQLFLNPSLTRNTG